MKNALTVFIAISFASIALFGVLGMHDTVNHADGCLPADGQAAICPMIGSIIDSFKQFSLASLGKNFAAFSILIPLLFAGSALWASALFKPKELSYSRRLRAYAFLSPQKLSLTNWLSLLENSPSSV